MDYLDKHPEIVSWASEELAIPYLSPKDGKVHRYFPDFYVEKKNKDGKIHKLLIEVKPNKETQAPKVPKKITPRYISESVTYAVNSAKWNAADAFCQKQGWKFIIMTEDHLFAGKF